MKEWLLFKGEYETVNRIENLAKFLRTLNKKIIYYDINRNPIFIIRGTEYEIISKTFIYDMMNEKIEKVYNDEINKNNSEKMFNFAHKLLGYERKYHDMEIKEVKDYKIEALKNLEVMQNEIKKFNKYF